MVPIEVDTDENIRNGTVPGIKNAAIRKLQQELGIPVEQISIDGLKYLTRLHYWAADTVTHGVDSVWGEHEIDYVLFMTISHCDDISLTPHGDEIDEVKWVTAAELEAMLNDETNLFSPWFRLIYHKFMKNKWWENLHQTMTTAAHCDYDTIHTFDPPIEHYGGAGKAGPLFSQHE
jgi:isopentenyl-diphosphate delta-isomerase type 1